MLRSLVGSEMCIRDSVYPNRHYEIQESTSLSVKAISEPDQISLFEDVSNNINHNHVDQSFDDYSRQSLLPKKLSQEGPGVAWIDWNNDGFDDVAIPSG